MLALLFQHSWEFLPSHPDGDIFFKLIEISGVVQALDECLTFARLIDVKGYWGLQMD